MTSLSIITRSKKTLSQGPNSFKYLAKYLAREREMKNKALKPQTGKPVQVHQHGFTYQVHLKEPLTFAKELQNSKLCSKSPYLPDIDNKDPTDCEVIPENVNDWNTAMELIKETEKREVTQSIDLASLQVKPGIRPFFNLSSIVNENSTLQKLVDLGTDLSLWEKEGGIDTALLIDFHQDVVPRIHFLMDLGIHPDQLGRIFSQNHCLFQQNFEDLKVRLNYLTWKKFTKDQILTIIDQTNSSWLNYSVPTLDAKLGFLQKLFHLKGHEVRQVTTACPQLILWKGTPTQLENNYMILRDCMGFNSKELGKLVKTTPKLFMAKDTDVIQEKFDLLHNEVGYSHQLLANFAPVLDGDLVTMKCRLAYLRRLKKDQFDPNLPCYVNPDLLVLSSDKKFCQKVAKTSLQLYEKFVLTL